MRRLVGPAILLLLAIHSSSYADVDLPSPGYLTNDINSKFYYVETPNRFAYLFPPYSVDTPRLYLWGLTGSETIGRVDGLMPVIRGHDYFFYADLQGKAASDNAWLASGGAGYRGLGGNHIWGGYLFLDRNVSEHHNVFYVLSPGAEVLHNNWDARLNFYIPVSERRKRGSSFFPSGDNQCGIHGDCQFVEFHGHQQFEHRFFDFEEVGTGVDGEVGLNIGRNNTLSVHGGGYYYLFQDRSNVRGLEARVEVPFQNNFALTLEANYDNKDRGAIVAGLRLQFGHTRPPRYQTIADHFYDRVARNLATVNTGSGTITQDGRKDEGLFLRRDNIFFFTASGGSLFTGLDSGTFENPLRADQFTTATLAAVKALTGNGNFYFNSGIYSFGATSVDVLQGQSLFGRSLDYRCTAEGEERPILDFEQIGTAALVVTGGNNIIDSIILQNQVAAAAPVITLEVDDNPSLLICNSVIDAEATVVGDNLGTVAASAIVGNNSNVVINSSVVQAISTVTGNNLGVNSVVAIGTNANTPVTFSNNNYILNNDTVLANAIVGVNNQQDNISTAIGIASTGSFTSNNFSINNSILISAANTENVNSENNSAMGIGNNMSAGSFAGNSFSLTNVSMTTTASTGSSNIGQNFANGFGDTEGIATNNNFSMLDSSMLVNAIVGEDNAINNNVAVGIGDLFGAIFNDNIININRSEVIVVASVGLANELSADNIAVALGEETALNFTGNVYSVSSSYLQATASVADDNAAGSVNLAFGVSSTPALGPNANIFNIDRSAFLIEALIGGDNAGTNTATALSANANTIVNVTDSFFDVFAIVNGVDTGTNQAIPTAGTGTFNITNTHFNLVEIP